MKIELGCGKNKTDDFIGIDIKDYGQEIVRDICKGLPFSDNTIEEIYSCHCLEHLGSEDLLFVMEEIWRVLKKDCIVFIRVPHSHCDEAFYPGHKSYWNEKMVNALINDPYQKENYNFEILENKKQGVELFIKLKKI